MPEMLWWIGAMLVLALLCARASYLWGKCEGQELGWEQGDNEIIALHKHHLAVIDGIENALATLSAGEMVAVRTATNDKVTALLQIADRKATKDVGDAKAVVAEWR